MQRDSNRSSGAGLERSCGAATTDWLRSTGPERGIELLEAWLHGPAYHPHRHDTYAICLTTRGVLAFHYRGSGEISTPGQVVVLHPDELHDGRAGTDAGFGYRQIYIDPALIADAARAVCGRACALPFVRAPVVLNPTLADAVTGAFADGGEPLAIDSLIVQVTQGLLAADPSCGRGTRPRRLDIAAIGRARAFLDAEQARVVSAAELEAVTGLTRYELARQFRVLCGTSPYRYLLMRRLESARVQIARGRPLSAVACDAGFADQAHLTRHFKATFGLTPTQYHRYSAGIARPTTLSQPSLLRRRCARRAR